jgi:endo-1,4-beta-mannosidase
MSMRTLLPLETPGGFVLGCNYWASHAGTAMWRDWRPEVIDADFARLTAHGLTWVRLFPLWPDFQPIHQLRGGAGRPVEMRFGEDPLPDDALGQAGVSAAMLARFDALCSLAEKHRLRLLVGLVTGWMSGRLFVPPALEGRDPITDPVSLAWQIRLVRALVRHAQHHAAIAAWDLGNECNCMGSPSSREAAFAWTAAVAHTIRAADPSRPIVSGMHSLGTPVGSVTNPWCIDDQADLTDILTTHPYP